MIEKSNINDMGNTKELIDRCHKAAKDNGFWNTETSENKAFAVILEKLFEANKIDRTTKKRARLDIYLASVKQNNRLKYHKKDAFSIGDYELSIKGSFEERLATSAIRLFDYCGKFGYELGEFDRKTIKIDSFGELLYNHINYFNYNVNRLIAVNNIYESIFRVCNTLEIDLLKFIELKLQYEKYLKR